MRRALLIVALTASAAGLGNLFAQAALQITNPAPGTVVNPGQTVVVNVSTSGGPVHVGNDHRTWVYKWPRDSNLPSVSVFVYGTTDSSQLELSIGDEVPIGVFGAYSDGSTVRHRGLQRIIKVNVIRDPN